MKICFFSDIHGNYEAFTVGYELLIKENADINIFLGDICGYYFDALKIWKILRDTKEIIPLLGNHDKLFLDFLKKGYIPTEYRIKYGPSLDFLIQECPQDFIDWLNKAKYFYTNRYLSLFCCHGGPKNFLTQYIYQNSDFPKTHFRYTITGHTHYPMFRFQAQQYCGNPGSMGQPRNGQPPSYASLCTENPMSWRIKYFDYDKRPLTNRLRGMNVPSYLHKVLWR